MLVLALLLVVMFFFGGDGSVGVDGLGDGSVGIAGIVRVVVMFVLSIRGVC